jgi:hypothetical protein
VTDCPVCATQEDDMDAKGDKRTLIRASLGDDILERRIPAVMCPNCRSLSFRPRPNGKMVVMMEVELLSSRRPTGRPK